MPSSLFSPFPAFVPARSGRQRGLCLVYSDLLRLMRSVSRLGGHWRGSWEAEENYLESQICVLNYSEESKLNFYYLILWEYLKRPDISYWLPSTPSLISDAAAFFWCSKITSSVFLPREPPVCDFGKKRAAGFWTLILVGEETRVVFIYRKGHVSDEYSSLLCFPRKSRVIPPPHSLNQSKCIVEAQWDWEILEYLT